MITWIFATISPMHDNQGDVQTDVLFQALQYTHLLGTMPLRTMPPKMQNELAFLGGDNWLHVGTTHSCRVQENSKIFEG